MLNLRKDHPDWPDRWVSGTVASELEKQKTKALAERKDFAFETNFSSDMVVGMVNEFKTAGFKITLCYFGLTSEDDSVMRVTLRAQTGGHDVADDVIRFNFSEGLVKVKQHLNLFENLTFRSTEGLSLCAPESKTCEDLHDKSTGLYLYGDLYVADEFMREKGLL